MEPKYLGECMEELRTHGVARFVASHRTPMLQLRDLGPDEAQDDASFHTAFMARDALKEAEAATPPSSELRLPPIAVGQFVAVEKRQGGIFQDRIGVGRARNVDVPLGLTKVSKYHAFFQQAPDGSFTVTDAGSTNGTFMNGRRLPEKQAVAIGDGQDVSFGPYRFTFFSADGFCEMVKRRASAR